MDAHWYVLDQGVFKSWVVYPCILKQAHIDSTTLLGTSLTVDCDHDRWAVNCYFQAAAARNAFILGQSMAAALCIPPVHPNPGSHTLHRSMAPKRILVPTSFFRPLTTQMTPAEQRDGRTLVCSRSGSVQKLGCIPLHPQTSTDCFHHVVGDIVDR